MAFIDISKLERNKATKPFHIAAGIEAFENDPWQLSDNECLLYQIHQERPDTFLKTAGEAQGFLKTFEPNQARTIQKRAEDMCGIGRLMSEGSKVELRIDGEKRSVDVPPHTYSSFYSNTPVASKEELAHGVERTFVEDYRREQQNRFMLRIRSVATEVNERKVKGVGLATFGLLGIGAGTAFGILAAPVLGMALGAVIGIVSGVAIVAVGLKGIGINFLKEVRLKFWS